MKYLGIEPQRPRVAVFDFTGCEGCELQLANKEETLAAFLDAIEVVNFREISSAAGDDYDIALVDGAISRDDEVERLEADPRAREGAGGPGELRLLRRRQPAEERLRPRRGQPRGLRRPAQGDPAGPGGHGGRAGRSGDPRLPGLQGRGRADRPAPHLGRALPLPGLPGLPGVQAALHRLPVRRGPALPGADHPGRLRRALPGRRAGLLGLPRPGRGLPTTTSSSRWPRERGFGEEEIDERLRFFGGFEGRAMKIEQLNSRRPSPRPGRRSRQHRRPGRERRARGGALGRGRDARASSR